MIKKVYGSTTSYTHYADAKEKSGEADKGEQLAEDDPANLMDDNGRKLLQGQLVDLTMSCSAQGNTKMTSIFLEIIGIMGRRYVQNEWPELLPGLNEQIKT